MQPWNDIKIEGTNIPSMVSIEEKKYLKWLGASYWAGNGHIVEIGPWLGGSTYSLASGMDKNPSLSSSNKKLFTYDNFIWRSFMSQRASLDINVGDSFREHFKKNLSKYSEFVVDFQESLPDEKVDNDTYADNRRQYKETTDLLKWNVDESVEILFVDGAKSWSGMIYLLNEFCESLIPNISLIVCQDYKYWGTYWVPVIMEILIDKLHLEHVLNNNTVSFKLSQKLSKDDISSVPTLNDINVENTLAYLDNASKRLRNYGDLQGARIVNLSKIRFLVHKGLLPEAIKVLQNAERKWPVHERAHSLNEARKFLEEQVGSPLKPLLVTKIRRKVYSYLKTAKSFFS